MGCLTPDWQQPKPDWEEARSMCRRVQLTPVTLAAPIFGDVLIRLRESHRKGGALLSAFQISPDAGFDWFASRNRLLEQDILASLLWRSEIRQALPELMIPISSEQDAAFQSCVAGDGNGFKMESPFLFDGHLAQSLHTGGAYWKQQGDGKAERQLALSFCEAAFNSRFAEVLSYVSYDMWTRWFHGIAWDWTSVLFDLRLRNLWILAVTDTD
jgi:hypothetical protein